MEQPKRYIYIRCSTDHQDYMQQMHTIQGYFAQRGINPESITAIYSEKEHGDVSHDKRKLSALLAECNRGDTIYISELSRIGRSVGDINQIVTKACNIGRAEAEAEDRCWEKELRRRLEDHERAQYGATIIQCKDGGCIIENRSVGGKALLFALSLAAELELENIRQRTRAAINAIQDKLERGEEHISKKGNVCTHLGRDKGCDTSQARAASIESKQKKAMQWRETNVGYNAVRRWVYAGQSDEWILEEFHQQHIAQPEHYSTPSGCDLSLPTLKKWKREFKLI